jgi:hypothetical protein
MNGGLGVWPFLRQVFVSNREILPGNRKVKAFRTLSRDKFGSKNLGKNESRSSRIG